MRAAYLTLYSIQSSSTPLVWLNSVRDVQSVTIRRRYNVVHHHAVSSSRFSFLLLLLLFHLTQGFEQ